MRRVTAEAQRRIPVPSEVAYLCIADFRNHHGHFLPKAFTDYRVEEGGFGAGTILSFKARVAGGVRAFRTRCEEPRPGQVLVERDMLSSLVTTTTVTPVGAEACTVRFSTVWETGPGVLGWLERLFAPALLGRVLRQELALLEDYAKALAGQAPKALQSDLPSN